jgi:penicillin-binding protein 1A
LLELTSAYAPFANGGWSATPHIVTRVATAEGRVLYHRRREAHRRVIAIGNVEAMNDMLHATMTSGTGKAAALPRHPAAGKTGTTQNYRDAWFIGYTSHYVGGVWVGNDDGKPMPGITGGSLPAQIWRSIMVEAHSGLRPVALPARDWSDGSWRFGWWGGRNPQADGRDGGSFFQRILNLF